VPLGDAPSINRFFKNFIELCGLLVTDFHLSQNNDKNLIRPTASPSQSHTKMNQESEK